MGSRRPYGPAWQCVGSLELYQSKASKKNISLLGLAPSIPAIVGQLPPSARSRCLGSGPYGSLYVTFQYLFWFTLKSIFVTSGVCLIRHELTGCVCATSSSLSFCFFRLSVLHKHLFDKKKSWIALYAYKINGGLVGDEMNDVPYRLRSCRSEILRSQYVDVRELRVCVGTWNVGGKFPPSDLNIEEWLDMEELADIYVIGFQEVVPLNAGNIFGAEDNRPVAVWEHIIRETLNKNGSDKSSFKCHSDPSSPSRFNPSDSALSMEHELLSGSDNDSDGELQPLIEQDHNCKTDEKFEAFPEEALACDVMIDRSAKRKMPEFVRIISKQMVGIFLSIWVRRSLRKHIQNLRVSTVGVGAMGYIGNKGSISVSMSIHQTPFCFVCCHLAAGEKDGDDLKRNLNVEEILRRTVFNPLHTVGMPMRIHDHERIIWLGDLNYRINLSYERTHELISKQDWDGLFESDQLKRELGKGCTFDGWFEGVISFPPTYKYEFDSEDYVSDESKSGRRTPAWCDRILSYGKGIRLLSYKRGELTLSDHRPVTAVYMAEVEVFHHRKLQRALTFTDADRG